MEAQFATKGITQQLTKYYYIIDSLALETAREIYDVGGTISVTIPFNTLKERLISHTSLTESQRIKKRLSLEPLGDQKPSQLLQHIEQLAEKSCKNDPVLQEIFLTCLPVSVQPILKGHLDKSTEQLTSLSLTALLQLLQKPLCLHSSVPSYLSLQISTLLPPTTLNW